MRFDGLRCFMWLFMSVYVLLLHIDVCFDHTPFVFYIAFGIYPCDVDTCI